MKIITRNQLIVEALRRYCKDLLYSKSECVRDIRKVDPKVINFNYNIKETEYRVFYLETIDNLYYKCYKIKDLF